MLEEYFDEGKVGVFYDDDITVALKAAEIHAINGFVPSTPWLIQERLKQDKNHWCWKGLITSTQEYVCTDFEGKFVDKGEGLVAVVHGGNLITPELICTAKTERKIIDNRAVLLNQEEVMQYISSFSKNRIYHINEILNLGTLPRNPEPLAIILPFHLVKTMKSGYYDKNDFVHDKIVIARTLATKEMREAYFDKASSENHLGNLLSFEEINQQQAQGNLLYLGDKYYCLYGGHNLYDFGRFAAVAAETPQRALDWIVEQQASQRTPINLSQFISGQGFVSNQAQKSQTEKTTKPRQAVCETIKTNLPREYKGKPLTQAQQEAHADIITRAKNLELD